MRNYFCLVTIVLLTSCNSGKDKTGTDIPKDSSTTVAPQKDTIPSIPAGKIDIESFGEIKLGQPYTAITKALGQPDSKSKAIEWGADGLMHEDWTWKNKGLVLNMSSEINAAETTLAVFSITAKSPCTFKTKAGTGIGSSYTEVQEAYKRDIAPGTSDKTQITVGSVYGGIIFTFKDDRVVTIFLGAAAD